jgi:hypothetical protein
MKTKPKQKTQKTITAKNKNSVSFELLGKKGVRKNVPDYFVLCVERF